MDYLSRLYEREIKDFFEVAKIKMTGATKEGKKFGKGPTTCFQFCVEMVVSKRAWAHGRDGKPRGFVSDMWNGTRITFI